MAAPPLCCGWRGATPRPTTIRTKTKIKVWTAPRSDIKVCIVADRGFGDQKLYRVLSEQLKFDYVIRFRANVIVTARDGETRTAAAWVGPGGRAKVLRGAEVTADRYQVGTVLCVRDKDSKKA